MSAILVLIGETTSAFISPLERAYTVFMARSGKQGITLIREHGARLVVVDAVSLGTNGDRICRMLRAEFSAVPIIHIRQHAPSRNTADAVLVHPVSARTLLLHVKRFVKQQPSVMLECGHFRMDVERKVIRIEGREVTLTPKMAALLEVFFRHPGTVLERKWLMQQIWNTDYVGDTRTLSVHIRYLRELLEPDPGAPKYLKTVRGTGYQFDCS
jgi:DNA-binding response OmpR family regulator